LHFTFPLLLACQLAGRINALLAEDDLTRCSMAIRGTIHLQLLNAIRAA
jgi:hypothetical protein